ncbi:MAG TPA: hypothetical protein VIS96_17085 [Terrimicrobiaceae bacterium]
MQTSDIEQIAAWVTGKRWPEPENGTIAPKAALAKKPASVRRAQTKEMLR